MKSALEQFRDDLAASRGDNGERDVALMTIAGQLIRIADSLEEVGYAAKVWSHPVMTIKSIGPRLGDSQLG